MGQKRAFSILTVLLLAALFLCCGSPAASTEPPAKEPEAVLPTEAPQPTPVSTPAPTPEPTPKPVTINGQVFDPGAESVTLAASDAQEVFDALAQFPDLKEATITEPALSPEELFAIRERFPDLDLTYCVALSDKVVPMDSEALDLSDVPAAELPRVLSLFPALRSVTLGEILPTAVQALLGEREDLSITFRFCGQTVSAQTKALDLSDADILDAAEFAALLAFAPAIREITVGEPTDAEIETLLAMHPREKGVVLHGTLTLLDCAFPIDAETIDFAARVVTDAETAEIERVLPLLTNLTEIDLYESKLSRETMDALFDGYPDLFFGFTFEIWDGFWTVRSDATAFSTMIGQKPGSHRWLLTEDDFIVLRYCKGLQALDLGHNGIQNLEFLRNWPHLKILILADTRVTDLSILAELQDLQYLELFMTDPDSYEPLTKLPNLLDLNLSHTKRENYRYRTDEEILVLTQIKSLERLWITKTLTKEQAQMLREGLPGVEFDFSSSGSTEAGWREHPRYFIMRQCFRDRQYYPFD